MNPADPRWLEILKASGWQTGALAIACSLILALVRGGVIPTDGAPLWVALPAVGAVVFWCLALASIGSALAKATDPMARFRRWRLRREQQRSARDYIDYMTEKERHIIGYLLHHKNKVFQADEDGGYAAPLIARGIVRPSGRPGQVVDIRRVPFEVPDHVWSVLEANRERFPYVPPTGRDTEVHPWAIHWMAR